MHGTTASSCQSGGDPVAVGVDRGEQRDASRDAEDGAGERGSTCAAESPALTCCGVAPSARASAEECLASSAVAHVMKTVLTAASATSVIVITSST